MPKHKKLATYGENIICCCSVRAGQCGVINLYQPLYHQNIHSLNEDIASLDYKGACS